MAVLIVEDEPWLSLDISEALEDEGYDVIAVAYADNAIEALEARNDIHTVFTDLDVRGSMDGLKLAAAVRKRWPPVNIIVTRPARGLLAVTRYPRELCLLPSRIAVRKWYTLCVPSTP